MALTRDGDVYLIDNAVADHTLARLRDRETSHDEMRDGMARLGRICGYELADELFETRRETVRTPLAEVDVEVLDGLDDVVLVSLLRGSLPFVDGLRDVFPQAREGMVRPERIDEEVREDGTFPMTVAYEKLPEIGPSDTVVVADPMMATGSSACATLDVVDRQPTPGNLILLTAITVPSGIEHVSSEFPDVDHVTVSVDDRLDEETGYVVPGLGDAGDRAFGTRSRRLRMAGRES